jgi:hypothetical protein
MGVPSPEMVIAFVTYRGGWGEEMWGEEMWGEEMWGEEMWGEEMWGRWRRDWIGWDGIGEERGYSEERRWRDSSNPPYSIWYLVF